MNRRRQAGDEVIYGLNAALAALERHPERVRGLWLSVRRDDVRTAALERAAHAAGVTVQRAAPAALERLAGSESHQGVVLKRQPLPPPAWKECLVEWRRQPPALLLALDGVMDPHNFGACLRSAAGAGAAALLYPRSRGAGVSPTVRRVASGGADLTPLVEVANLARALGELARAGFDVVGLAGEAGGSLDELAFGAPTVIVAGGEHDGLRRLTREACTELVRIPLAPGLDSLNLSVAVGIALFAARRGGRRNSAPGPALTLSRGPRHR